MGEREIPFYLKDVDMDMKTKYEWHGEWCAGKYDSISAFAEAVQKDTWERATKEQAEKDGTYNSDIAMVPFPTDLKTIRLTTPAREHSVNPMVPDIEIRGIYQYVAVSNHGSFLKTFAEAMIRADGENFALLRPVAMVLIEKYGLDAEFAGKQWADKLAKDN